MHGVWNSAPDAVKWLIEKGAKVEVSTLLEHAKSKVGDADAVTIFIQTLQALEKVRPDLYQSARVWMTT